MSEMLDDESGLPDPPGGGAEDPSSAPDNVGDGEGFAPLEQNDAPTDRQEILQIINNLADAQRQIQQLWALLAQSDDTATGGSQFNPKIIGANTEGTEPALTDTWSISVDMLPVDVWKVVRVVYNHAGDKKLYEYYRKFSYDSIGALYAISAETRVEVDAASAT